MDIASQTAQRSNAFATSAGPKTIRPLKNALNLLTSQDCVASGKVTKGQRMMRSPRLGKVHDARTNTAAASLAGPFRVTLQDGGDITPKSALRQAILAVLVTSKGQIRSRKSLQSMFWGSAAPNRACSSLRTAIYLLRQDLHALGKDLIRADSQSVALAPDRISASPWPSDTGDGAQFLEGMDLALADCEGFEDWLRQHRNLTREGMQTPEPGAANRSAAALLQANATHMALGLLPVAHACRAQLSVLAVEGLIDQIARFFMQMTFLDVHDLRGSDTRVVPLPIGSGTGPSHWLQPVLEKEAGRMQVHLRLSEAGSNKLIWLSPPIEAGALSDGDMAWALGETIAELMRASPAAQFAQNLYPLTVLAAMFSLDAAQILETERHLERLIEAGGGPVLECLRLFAQVFKVNEVIGQSAGLDLGHLSEAMSRVSAADPHLALCESLIGYTAHMLLGENEVGNCLVESAYRRAPNLPLNLDHLAVLRMVQGDLDGAEAAFKRCITAGALSPIRYTYEVTGAMIYLSRGDFIKSLHFANQAMFRKPKYLAGLRYAMAGLALSNNGKDARRMLVRIEALRPDYDLSDWVEGFARRSPAEMSNRLAQGLQSHGLL